MTGKALAAMNSDSSFLGVSWFEIPVAELDRARSFYEHLLALTLVRERVDGHEMALFPAPAPGAGATGALAVGEVYVPAKAGPIVYFGVTDIAAVLARARAAGAAVLLAPKFIDGQGHVAEIEDSEGNRIALFQSLVQSLAQSLEVP